MDNETRYALAINAIVSASLISLVFIFLMIKEYLSYKKQKKEAHNGPLFILKNECLLFSNHKFQLCFS